MKRKQEPNQRQKRMKEKWCNINKARQIERRMKKALEESEKRAKEHEEWMKKVEHHE